jgi:hypothetical protein
MEGEFFSLLFRAYIHSRLQSLVTEYRALGPDSFWNKYSENNKKLPITSILQRMKKARLEENSRTMEHAKSLYGDKFREFFSYKGACGSEPQVLVRPSAIARRFHSMSAYNNAVSV